MASTKILIIDDEQDVIDLLSLHLRKGGFALSTATDGAAGLRLAAYHPTRVRASLDAAAHLARGAANGRRGR